MSPCRRAVQTFLCADSSYYSDDNACRLAFTDDDRWRDPFAVNGVGDVAAPIWSQSDSRRPMDFRFHALPDASGTKQTLLSGMSKRTGGPDVVPVDCRSRPDEHSITVPGGAGCRQQGDRAETTPPWTDFLGRTGAVCRLMAWIGLPMMPKGHNRAVPFHDALYHYSIYDSQLSGAYCQMRQRFLSRASPAWRSRPDLPRAVTRSIKSRRCRTNGTGLDQNAAIASPTSPEAPEGPGYRRTVENRCAAGRELRSPDRRSGLGD